jgi:hypothetical protein
VPDSDGDGIVDGLEVLAGTDPTDANDKDLKSEDLVMVFSFFRGNGEAGVYLAYSRDGLSWSELNGGTPVLAPIPGKLTRDPHITRGPDGTFHMVWTNNWSGTDLGYASSSDLVNWTTPRSIDVMGSIPGAENVWAPEAVYDDENSEFMIFWSSRVPGQTATPGRQYKTTTTDFVSITPPTLFFDPGKSVIDATLIEAGNGTYGMFIKGETAGDKSIYYTTSDHESGPYSTALGPPIVGLAAGTPNAEGPTCAKLGNTWFLYWDHYYTGEYGVAFSSDLSHWITVSDQLEMPAGRRHGTVFTMPAEEFDATFFPPVLPGPPAVLQHRYSFDTDAGDSVGSANGSLMSGASVSDGAARLDGVNDYVNLPGATIAINTYTSLTFEAWWTHNSQASWQRVFDFGSNSPERDYIFYSPVSAPGDIGPSQNFAIENNGVENRLLGTNKLPNGSYHMACVVDAINGELRYYLNGALVGSSPLTNTLAGVSNANAYLGKSLFASDAYLSGSLDEFRIWQGTLTADEVAASFAAGPDDLPPPRDIDKDGMPDLWETANGLEPEINDSADDKDGDGVFNLLEYAFGLDPRVPNPRALSLGPLVRGVPLVEPTADYSAVDIHFMRRKNHASTGLVYIVQFSDDLLDWTDSTEVPLVIADDGDMELVRVTRTATVGEETQFFRVAVAVVR